MWFRKNPSRLAALQAEVAKARAETEHLRASLEGFTAACMAAGVGVTSAAADAVPGVPPALLAATRWPKAGGEAVTIDLPAGKAIAVIGPGADAEAAMPVIAGAVVSAAPRHVTSITRQQLPEGLLAVAALPAGAGLSVIVARGLPAAQSRHAVHAAIAAARRHGWAGGYKAGAVALAAALAWHAVRTMPVRAALTATTAGAVGATMMAVMPPVAQPIALTPVAPVPVLHAARRRTGPEEVPVVNPSQPGPQPSPAIVANAAAVSPAVVASPPSGSPPASAGLTVSASPSPSPVVSASATVSPGISLCLQLLALGVCV